MEVTYELWTLNVLGDWKSGHGIMDEEKMRSVAKLYGFRKKAVEKLINHKSKKFTFIKCSPKGEEKNYYKEFNVVKNFKKQQS